MRLRIYWLLLAVVIAASAACGVSAQQACADLSAAECKKFSDCANALFTELYGDMPTCVAAVEASCGSGLAVKNTGSSASDAENCSKAVPSLSCTGLFDNSPPKDCLRQSSGPVVSGAACGTSGQCSQTNVCQIDTTTGCGKCIAPVASGGACNAASDCISGLVCSGSVCVAPASSGQACTTTNPDGGAPIVTPCQIEDTAGNHLECELTLDGGLSGSCSPALAAGSACNLLNDLCDKLNGYFCTPHGVRCTLALWATAGQPCGYNKTTGDYTACTASSFCGNVDQTTLMGTCTAPAAAGASCDVSKGPLCTPPAVCLGVNLSPDAGPDGGVTSGVCTTVDPSTCH